MSISFFFNHMLIGNLIFLFNILFCSFLGPFCPEAEEQGIGTGHMKTDEQPAFLLREDPDSIRMDIPCAGMTRPISWVPNLSSLAELIMWTCSAFLEPLRSQRSVPPSRGCQAPVTLPSKSPCQLDFGAMPHRGAARDGPDGF